LPIVLAIVTAGLLLAPPASAQDPPAARLRVYIDCNDCFAEYIRDETRWVDFVREPQAADIHVFVTSNETGSGGREYAIRFSGAGRFAGVEETFRSVSTSGETEDTRRRGILRAVTVGLVNYAARAGLIDGLDVSVEPAESAEAQGPASRAADPWNLWVFSLRGDGTINAEESQRETSWEAGFGIDRVSENWRVSVGAEFERETERFNLDEENPITSRTRNSTVNWILVKSLGPHLSAGLRGTIRSSTFDNIKLEMDASPAVEYNLFPYSEYNRRQLRFQYSVGVRDARYHEVTLFDKTRERFGVHRFSTTLEQQERWGTLEAGVVWSQYLYDLATNRLEGEGEVSLRIARGLSADIEGNVSRIRDQISLPRRDVTPEELLLRLRQLRSGYEVELQIGLTYTFGSLFNNIVNPRFGQ
jgi:hypothetical protein